MKAWLLTFAMLIGVISAPLIEASESAYVGLLGGANLLRNEHYRHKDIVYNTGYAAGCFGGYGFCNNIRVEGEFFYRRNNIKHIRMFDGDLHCGHRRSYSLMGNCLYDFDICYPVMPYVGVGLGADRDILVINIPSNRKKNYKMRFAAQAIAGFSYPVCDYTEMSIDYRYHWARSHLSNNTFTLGLKYIF